MVYWLKSFLLEEEKALNMAIKLLGFFFVHGKEGGRTFKGLKEENNLFKVLHLKWFNLLKLCQRKTKYQIK